MEQHIEQNTNASDSKNKQAVLRDRQKILRSCALGSFIIILLGVLLHNAYFWTRPLQLLAILSPVNESVWEHLKMAFWAVIVFSLIEYPVLWGSVTNYLFAKAVGVSLMIACILIVFYSYTAYTGKSILWVDIGSFVLGAILCQWTCWKLYRTNPLSRSLQIGALVYLIILASLFAAFTYFPPELEIFRDHSSETSRLHN